MSHYYSSVKQINKSNSANGDLSENCVESKCSSKSDEENDEVDLDDADEDTENYDDQHSVKLGQQMKRASDDYDQQSTNGDFDSENTPSDCGPEFFKQQLSQNKSKKQLLMSNTSSSQFTNLSNKMTNGKKTDTL